MRVLGIDYGRRRIGLALSDEGGILASPLPTYVRGRSEGRDIAALSSLIDKHGVTAIVVGLPLNMDGSRGEMAREAEEFADRRKLLRDSLSAVLILQGHLDRQNRSD
jgi:putative Holliday junction resolvase